MKQKKIMKSMLSIVLALALIVPTTWVPAENNAKVAEAASSETRVINYNNQIKKVVSGYEDRVTLVDQYTEAGISWNNLSLYTCDYNAEDKAGLHPNSKGMQEMEVRVKRIKSLTCQVNSVLYQITLKHVR